MPAVRGSGPEATITSYNTLCVITRYLLTLFDDSSSVYLVDVSSSVYWISPLQSVLCESSSVYWMSPLQSTG